MTSLCPPRAACPKLVGFARAKQGTATFTCLLEERHEGAVSRCFRSRCRFNPPTRPRQREKPKCRLERTTRPSSFRTDLLLVGPSKSFPRVYRAIGSRLHSFHLPFQRIPTLPDVSRFETAFCQPLQPWRPRESARRPLQRTRLPPPSRSSQVPEMLLARIQPILSWKR